MENHALVCHAGCSRLTPIQHPLATAGKSDDWSWTESALSDCSANQCFQISAG